MNTIQFIKEHGVDKAREVLNKYQDCYMPEVFKYWSEQMQDFVLAPKYASCLVSDLKRLVESVEIVESWGGAKDVKASLSGGVYGIRLKEALEDYESIYGGEHV
ncbi:MAG TPA: hypothetical protein EYH52_11015 [Acinetobacter venetianus]|uniref:hypothetical protein n=1 Tax=Acinetobacter venetianus TaxID=52133 RepID=UPI001A12FE8E|nr:hypothetical protein [Acinetobacter venetianus]HIQ35150.1 hypothetical protein [Acinetobacter venetianus]